MQNQQNNKNIISANNLITVTIKVSKLLKISEAASFLNMNEDSLRDLTSRGEIIPIEVNGQMYFDESELWDWMYKQNPIMIKNENPTFNIFAN